jgi:hypothetical protein
MKKHGGTGKKMVMVALLAVLLISLGFLSKQVKEGMEKMEEDKLMEDEEKEDIKEGFKFNVKRAFNRVSAEEKRKRQLESDRRAAETASTIVNKLRGK